MHTVAEAISYFNSSTISYCMHVYCKLFKAENFQGFHGSIGNSKTFFGEIACAIAMRSCYLTAKVFQEITV